MYVNATADTLAMKDGDIIDVHQQNTGGCIASPTPATFRSGTGAPGDHFLAQPKALAAATVEDAILLALQLGGDVATAPQSSPGRVLLGHAERAVLIAWLDAEHAATGGMETDLRRTISTAELTALVGAGAVRRLDAAFGAGEPPGCRSAHDLVRLRRVGAAAGAGFVAFHADTHSRRTMQVALNGDDEYAGGRLVFATGDGFVAPRRPAGTATVHTNRTVHGVTALASGVRYGLFLCTTSTAPTPSPGAAAVDFGYLEAAVAQQFVFFDAAVQFLDAASDTELAEAAADYRRRLPADASPRSTGVELAWRVHMLHPLAYLRAASGAGASAASRGPGSAANEWAGVDLVAAMRRQGGFMRRVLSAHPALGTADGVADAVRQYRQFLELARRGDRALAPTTAIDLAWHTHQQHPERYARECVAIAGRFLDHSDEVAGAELGRATAHTGAAWRSAYGEPLLG